MKITIKISDRILQTIVDCIKESNVTITVAELKANPKLAALIQHDLDTMYFEDFADGLYDVDFVEALGLESS